MSQFLLRSVNTNIDRINVVVTTGNLHPLFLVKNVFIIVSDEEADQITIISPRLKRKVQEQERGSSMMKLDAIFAPMRSESVDELRTSIRIRGMGDVNLKPQVIQKKGFDHNKMDQAIEQKKIQQKRISMPDKPTKYKKPKPKSPPNEPSPTPQKDLKPIKDPTPPLKELTPLPNKELSPELTKIQTVQFPATDLQRKVKSVKWFFLQKFFFNYQCITLINILQLTLL